MNEELNKRVVLFELNDLRFIYVNSKEDFDIILFCNEIVGVNSINNISFGYAITPNKRYATITQVKHMSVSDVEKFISRLLKTANMLGTPEDITKMEEQDSYKKLIEWVKKYNGDSSVMLLPKVRQLPRCIVIGHDDEFNVFEQLPDTHYNLTLALDQLISDVYDIYNYHLKYRLIQDTDSILIELDSKDETLNSDIFTRCSEILNNWRLIKTHFSRGLLILHNAIIEGEHVPISIGKKKSANMYKYLNIVHTKFS